MFPGQPEVRAEFTTVADGTMAIDGGWERRLALLADRGLTAGRVVHAGLAHGNQTTVVSAADGGQVMPATDGLITSGLGLGLAMTAADCLLLYIVDAKNNRLGLAHAGSKGLAQGVMTEFLKTWRGHFGPDLSQLQVEVSPAICPAHYTVDRVFAKHFDAWPEAQRPMGEQVQLDLRLIARQQLLAGGVSAARIRFSPTCTYETQGLFSYRRDHPARPQLQLGYLVQDPHRP